MTQTQYVTKHEWNRFRVFDFAGRFIVNGLLVLLSLVCVIPIIVVLSASFSSEDAIGRVGYTLWPMEFSTAAYQVILSDPAQVARAYGVTSIVTVVGTILGLTIMSLLAFALSRRNFGPRRPISFFVF